MAARPKKGMGRKRAEATDDPGAERTTIINLKGTIAYSEWLEAAHRKTHFPKATIFRLAVIDWAERNGLPTPPEF